MASVPSSPSMNVMVDTITKAMEEMFTNRNVAGPPRYVIQSTVRWALRDIDAGRAPLRRFNGVRTVAGARRYSPRLIQYAPSVCLRHISAATFARRIDGAPSTPMSQPPMSSPNAFSLPTPSSTVPPEVAAHWNGSAAGARGWPPGFAYDLDTALPRASTATPPLRSYANVTAATPRPIGSGRHSSSVEGKDAPLL
jgi:hypothetical protein